MSAKNKKKGTIPSTRVDFTCLFVRILYRMAIIMIFLKAFLIGGLICVVGQLLIDLTKLTPARILVMFVVLGVVLGAVGLYQPLVDWAGAGATVPLTGFGNALVQGTKDALREQGALGIINGPLTASSAGITVAMISGLFTAFVTKPKSK